MKRNKIIIKNVLDLQYSTSMQYHNTAIVILCTYLVGVLLAFITKQAVMTNPFHLLTLTAVSSFVITATVIAMSYFRRQMDMTLKEIKRLCS